MDHSLFLCRHYKAGFETHTLYAENQLKAFKSRFDAMNSKLK